MYGYVYETTNLINGKKYIGQHKGQYLPTYLGSGKVLKRAIEKHGTENFQIKILVECESKEELNTAEIAAINKIDATKNSMYYNIANGGSGGNTRSGMTEEQFTEYCAKLKAAQNEPELLAKRSKISKAVYDRPGVREKLSEHSRTKWTPEMIEQHKRNAKITNAKPETKIRRSEAAKKNFESPESRNRLRTQNLGRKAYNDGIKNYSLFPDDPKINELGLVLGLHGKKIREKREKEFIMTE